MEIRFRGHLALLVAIAFIIGVCFIDGGAQRRRRRSSRRVTHPVASPSPTPDATSGESEPRVISTADQNATDGDQPTDKSRTRKQAKPKAESDPDEMRQTITTLSDQVTKLSEKLTEMEEQQRTLVDMERLTRAEQRAEGLRAQLIDVQAKESDLQGQLDQVEFALQPENIERVVGTFGTTHPEEAREQRRRQLDNQRTRIRAQLDQLAQNRVRLESAIATADAEVDLLRKRTDKYNQQQNQMTPTAQPPAETPPPKPPEDLSS